MSENKIESPVKIPVKYTSVEAKDKEGKVIMQVVEGKETPVYIQNDVLAIAEMTAMADNRFLLASEYEDFGPLKIKVSQALFQEKEGITLNVGEAGLLKKICNRMPGPQDPCVYTSLHLSTIPGILAQLR